MRSLTPSIVATALVLGAGAAAAGSVAVRFVQPETYTDILDNDQDAMANLEALTHHFQSLGQKYVPEGQTLHIDVMDIDLAGRLRPLRRGGMVRVVGGQIDWPRITLRYQLQGAGVTPQPTEETLTDMAYTLHLGRDSLATQLDIEKRLLRTWFRKHFAKP